MSAVFGDPRDRSADQVRIFANEFHRALGGFGLKTVAGAVTKVIQSHKFGWTGALAEVRALCVSDDGEWRDALGLKDQTGLRTHLAEPNTFERDGRTTAEEIEFRAREIAEMKKLHGLKSRAEVMLEENRSRSAPLGPNLDGASPQFLALIGENAAPSHGVTESGMSNTAANQSSRSLAASSELDAVEWPERINARGRQS